MPFFQTSGINTGMVLFRKNIVTVSNDQGYIFWRKLLIYSPSARVKYLISSLGNLNFGVIPPWLEKILNLAPLKCLEMPPNHPDICELSD